MKAEGFLRFLREVMIFKNKLRNRVVEARAKIFGHVLNLTGHKKGNKNLRHPFIENGMKMVKSGDMGVVPMQQLNHNIKNKEKFKATNTCVKPMYSIAQPDGSFSINENAVRSTKDIQTAFCAHEIRRIPLTPQDEMRAGMNYFH
ncbi:hypothetical protein Tco_1043003 [Tanacetum coccineum]|uniref:DNA-directed RNA polymerase n=1 Tax=Tanacetum coccineum TaxID=301880 RepID=A0ABQ5GL71_9ASTR